MFQGWPDYEDRPFKRSERSHLLSSDICWDKTLPDSLKEVTIVQIIKDDEIFSVVLLK